MTSGAPAASARSTSTPTGSQNGAGAGSQPLNSAALRKLLVVGSDLPSGWIPTSPYGWSDLILGGLHTCQGTGSNQVIAAPAADGQFASVLTAFDAPQGSGSGDFILQNVASFVSVNAATGYVDQLQRQIASCPSYSLSGGQTPRLSAIPPTGAQSLAFTEGNGAYDAYVIVTRVGNVVGSLADGSYLSPSQKLLAQYLTGKTAARMSHVIG